MLSKLWLFTAQTAFLLVAGWFMWQAFESGQIRQLEYFCYDLEQLPACESLLQLRGWEAPGDGQ